MDLGERGRERHRLGAGDLFLGGEIACLDAADSNDSGDVDMSDPVYLLDFLFKAGGRPPAPYPGPGPDPGPGDALGCAAGL